MTRRRLTGWASLTGIVAAMVTLAFADLIAQFVAQASSPIFAVGAFVIDIVPSWVKDAAIALFGTGDKVALLVCLALAVAILAVLAGVLEYRSAPWGVLVLVVVGIAAAAAAVTRAGASAAWAVPTMAGALAGALVLSLTTRRLRTWAAAVAVAAAAATVADRHANDGTAAGRAAVTRRGFFLVAGVSAAGAVVAGAAARAMSAATTAANRIREAISLPRPAVTAAVIPAGAELGIPDLTPLITPNASFFRIDTALQVPVIDPQGWRLRITGLVEEDVEIGYRELLRLPLRESAVTLSCVSNEVGGDLVGNAIWLGYPIREILARAKPLAGADMVLSTSIDGFTASTPLEVLLDESRDSLLAVGMNGEPLPLEHGFPVRMVVPGLYGYVSATKWVTELRVTRFADDLAYWTVRGWSARGPVKTSSRIDVPRRGQQVPAGKVAVAGVAWAPHTGVAGVEVRVDGGPWRWATLADAISADTWRQWVFEWDAAAGSHTIEARATDAAGTSQSGDRVPVVPDGAEGWHSITVGVV